MAASLPDWRIIGLALLYSVGAHGIMTLNDFKSVEGDQQMGIASLPVQLGVKRAVQFACLVMAVPQIVVVYLLFAWSLPYFAAIVLAFLIGQIILMLRLLKRPRELAPWYNATGTSLYVLGMLVSAIALRPYFSGIS
jgi:chlorophyll synthase